MRQQLLVVSANLTGPPFCEKIMIIQVDQLCVGGVVTVKRFERQKQSSFIFGHTVFVGVIFAQLIHGGFSFFICLQTIKTSFMRVYNLQPYLEAET